MFSETKDKSDNYFIDSFIQFLFKLTTELNLPGLKQYGIKEKELELICKKTEIKNNPVKLTEEDLIGILLKRL